jgi:hypothetical protein
VSESVGAWLIRYLEGSSAALLDVVRTRLEVGVSESPSVLEQILLNDLEQLEDFFAHGPAMLRAHLEKNGPSPTPIPPDAIDPSAEKEPEGWFRDRSHRECGQGEFFDPDPLNFI